MAFFIILCCKLLAIKKIMEMTKLMIEWENNIAKKLDFCPDLKTLYKNCFESTISTAMTRLDGTTYILTGDIPAMWLRDSSAQVTPYLPVARHDSETLDLLKGMLERQFKYILIDPYANAFNGQANGNGHKDDTDFYSDWIWERKFETDSLCYPFWFAGKLFSITNDKTIFSENFLNASRLAIKTLEKELSHTEKSTYKFIRHGEFAKDTLENEGKGAPATYTGMVWSGFRPSDDKCTYPYFIAGNLFVVVTLKLLKDIYSSLGLDSDSKSATKLCEIIENGIKDYGIVNHPQFGEIYAYETDGNGNYLLMDDANVPSLLALPYIGYCSTNDKIYQNTRNFVLSKQNPYYFEGKCAQGVGSPHTPKDYIWHISIILRALTSNNDKEISDCFDILLKTHANTFVMHEGFHKDDPTQFTRPWFAWANSLFAILVQNNIDKIESLVKR